MPDEPGGIACRIPVNDTVPAVTDHGDAGAALAVRYTAGHPGERRAAVSLFSTVPASHTRILAKHAGAVAAAVDDVARRGGVLA